MTSRNVVPVAVIGAGPYGLSVAAHLAARGIAFRIFGSPMASWRTQMPQGMFLKSEGHASSLSDPAGAMTLENFCKRHGQPYEHFGVPIPIRLFVDYGLAFQRELVPGIEDIEVSTVHRGGDGFRLVLTDGSTVSASRVVVAVGCDPFRRIPRELIPLGRRLLSHSADHHEFGGFAGKMVCVVGAGAAATDVAAALHAVGARVHLVARAQRLLWVSPRTGQPRLGKWARLDVLAGGRFGQGYAYSQAPHLFRFLPGAARAHVVRTYLGPRGGWLVRECVGSLPQTLGASVVRAREADGGARLDLALADGGSRTIEADHVIAATGYGMDVDRMSVLAPDLRKRVTTMRGGPELSGRFESSVPGLYFAGYAAAYSFGPLMRFVAGSDFAARRIAGALASSFRSRDRWPMSAPARAVPAMARPERK